MDHREQTGSNDPQSKKKVLIKGYTTAAGRTVPDHYRSSPAAADSPKGTFIERRILNPKRPR